MAAKPLITHTRLLEVLNYDPKTGLFVWKWRSDVPKQWNTRFAGTVAGCVDQDGYIKIRIDSKGYAAQRLAWFFVTKEWPKVKVDHKNGNIIDNRFKNLREATDSQNSSNKKKPVTNTSGIKGVSWAKTVNKWYACIGKNGRHMSLGYFIDIEDAANAYRNAADMLHRDFANYG